MSGAKAATPNCKCACDHFHDGAQHHCDNVADVTVRLRFPFVGGSYEPIVHDGATLMPPVATFRLCESCRAAIELDDPLSIVGAS